MTLTDILLIILFAINKIEMKFQIQVEQRIVKLIFPFIQSSDLPSNFEKWERVCAHLISYFVVLKTI